MQTFSPSRFQEASPHHRPRTTNTPHKHKKTPSPTLSTPSLLPFSLTVLTRVKLSSTVPGATGATTGGLVVMAVDAAVGVKVKGALVGGEVAPSKADAIDTSVGLTRSCEIVKRVGGWGVVGEGG